MLDDDAPLGALVPDIIPTPKRPSQPEVEAHNLTHVPFAPWCPFCVSGKAKDKPHKRSRQLDDEHVRVPRLECDFCIIDGDRVVLTVCDATTSFTQAIMLPAGKLSDS